MDFLFTLICGAIGGFLLYLFDKSSGPKLFKSWYDLTHKAPLPDVPGHGFVHGRAISAKVSAAVVFAIIGGVVLLLLGMSHPLTSLIGALGLLVGLIIAFVLAPLALKLDTQQVKEVISKLEDLEEKPARPSPPAQKIRPKEEPAEAPVKDPKAPEPKEEKETEEKPKKDDDWRGGVKKFLDN